MVDVTCKTCGKTFSGSTRQEAAKQLKKHCNHDIIGEATLQRTRYGSNA
ncbi:MAG TPA: hypothetical protein VMW85_02630 [Methanomassiliicoccales archaeon]|nr:hypothetical protein [Methanomassiliicoccales archaeon]